MTDLSDPGQQAARSAERIQRRRIGLMTAVAALFVIWQAIFLLSPHPDIGRGGLAGNWDETLMNLVFSGVLLALIGTGGALRKSKAIRALLDDESTLAHRQSALAVGYWAAMVATVGVYAYALVAPVRLVDALHIVLSLGVAAPLARFVQLERRAQPRD